MHHHSLPPSLLPLLAAALAAQPSRKPPPPPPPLPVSKGDGPPPADLIIDIKGGTFYAAYLDERQTLGFIGKLDSRTPALVSRHTGELSFGRRETAITQMVHEIYAELRASWKSFLS